MLIINTHAFTINHAFLLASHALILENHSWLSFSYDCFTIASISTFSNLCFQKKKKKLLIILLTDQYTPVLQSRIQFFFLSIAYRLHFPFLKKKYYWAYDVLLAWAVTVGLMYQDSRRLPSHFGCID